MLIPQVGKLKDKRLELDRIEGNQVYFKGEETSCSILRVEFGEEDIEKVNKMYGEDFLKQWIKTPKFSGRYTFKTEAMLSLGGKVRFRKGFTDLRF